MNDRLWIALLLVCIASCGSGSSLPMDVNTSPPSATLTSLGRLLLIDAQAYQAFPADFQSMAGKGLVKDASLLLGRNHEWGYLYSPRFQLGAGRALRITLAAQDFERANKAFLGIMKGTEAIDAAGYVSTTLPPEILNGGSLSDGDIASAASFFLGDACMGLLALDASGAVDSVTQQGEFESVSDSLERGSTWLASKKQLLMNYDERAPNRLLYDSLAFHACGKLSQAENTMRAADVFVQSALELLQSDGYFYEGGGWDTSYQAVSINIGKDLLLTDYESVRLEESLNQAAAWLARRVDEEGWVDSSGNKRTCGGGEGFLGDPKKIALDEVFMALAYIGIMRPDATSFDAASRVSFWHANNLSIDPCFSPD